jgi:hypothetical protein
MQRHFRSAPAFVAALVIASFSLIFFGSPAIHSSRAGDEPKSKITITHAFLATGGETYIANGDDKIAWQYPHGSRDGWVLPNGNVLLALSQSKKYPGGAAIEVTRDNKILFEFKGRQQSPSSARIRRSDSAEKIDHTGRAHKNPLSSSGAARRQGVRDARHKANAATIVA